MSHSALYRQIVRIPAKINNHLVIGFLEFLRIVQHVFRRHFLHEKENAAAMKHHIPVILAHNGYIEDQRSYTDLRFGSYTLQYCGCEIIALYNTICALEGADKPDLLSLISSFEADGILLNGKFGTSPKALYRFLKANGFPVLFTLDPSRFRQIAEQYEALILTMYNDCDDVTEQIHTVCITIHDHQLYAHNVYGNGSVIGPYRSIETMIRSFHCGKAQAISLIGVHPRHIRPKYSRSI